MIMQLILPQTWRTFKTGLAPPREKSFPFLVDFIRVNGASLIRFKLGLACGFG